ncbi:MAG: DUF370 domain-containing protein [Dictyoglomaceae bacterium]
MSIRVKLINIGFGNMVVSSRIVAIISPDSAPIKRFLADAREKNELIDATYGRKTRAVLVLDSGHIVLSALHPETIASRIEGTSEEEEK